MQPLSSTTGKAAVPSESPGVRPPPTTAHTYSNRGLPYSAVMYERVTPLLMRFHLLAETRICSDVIHAPTHTVYGHYILHTFKLQGSVYGLQHLSSLYQIISSIDPVLQNKTEMALSGYVNRWIILKMMQPSLVAART